MKKLVSLFLAMTLVLTNFQGWDFLSKIDLFENLGLFNGVEKSFAENGTLLEDLKIYYTISDNEVTITDADTSISGDLSIPKTIEGYPVTSIGGFAFENCTSLTSVNIPEEVTSIGRGAFRGCKSLTNIEIPKAVTSIGEYAFAGCSSAKSINFLAEVTKLEKNIFAACESLTSIKIPDGVTSIGNAVFYNCKSLTNIDMPDSVESIGESAFGECDALISIKIPQKVTAINGYTFSGCDKLTSIDLHEGVISIGENAFEECISLKSITLPQKMTCIEAGVFKSCSSLESVDIPEELTDIKKFAFYECTSLKNIKMPNDLKNIGENGFLGCTSLKNIKLSEKAEYIASHAFYGCSSLTSVLILPKENIFIDSDAFEACNALTIYGYSNSYVEEYARWLAYKPFQGIDVDLNESKLNLIKGESYTLKATIKPENLFTDDIEWSSSDDSIVSVDQNGNIKANSIGHAVITASNKVLGNIASCEVQVSYYKIDQVDIIMEDEEYFSTGKQIKPEIIVKDGETVLTEGVDYIVEYGENKYVGQGSITVVGKNNYGGSKTVFFDIGPRQYVKVTFDTGTEVIVSEAPKYDILRYEPEDPTKNGYVFVGWFRDVDDITTEYSPEYIYEEDTTYTAKWAHVEMLGAQVKAVVDDKSGIRFGTKIYDDGDEIVEKGTLIIPVALLSSGQTLTLDTPKVVKSVGKVNYEVNKDENYITYLGTLVGIARDKFDSALTASSYVIYKDKSGNKYTVYSPYKKGSTTVNTLLGNNL